MTTNGEGNIIAKSAKKKRKRKVLCFTMAEDLYPKAKERAVEMGFVSSFSAYLDDVRRKRGFAGVSAFRKRRLRVGCAVLQGA